MDKWLAQREFWTSFGIPAYDEQATFTKGEAPAFPHITYQSFGGRIGQTATLSASLWYRELTWAGVMQKADEILKYLAENEPLTIKTDNGYVWFKVPENTPFAQPMRDDEDDQIKRIVLTVEAECLSAF